MITIERVEFPYCVAIPVSEKNVTDGEWYNGIRLWLKRNVEDFKIIETGAWVVAVGLKTEHDAIMLKLAFESDTPMPPDRRLTYRNQVAYEAI